MPDPIDTLRNDIAIIVRRFWDHHPDASALDTADTIMAEVLKAATDEQRRALLETLGYEVREGCLGMRGPTNGKVCFHQPRCQFEPDKLGPFSCERDRVLVLRDQRETTDA